MDDKERRRLDMFIRVRRFGEDNAGDFPAGGIGATQFAEVDTVIGLLETESGEQARGSGDARREFVGKNIARENLREALSEIAATARSMNYQFPGISNQFRMPRGNNDQQLLAAARAFFAESAANQADFIAYGLPAAFRTALQTLITAFENSLDAPGTAIDEQVEATANIDEAVRRGMVAVRILNGVVRNIYRADRGKLAAWTSASHIERAPVTEDAPVEP